MSQWAGTAFSIVYFWILEFVAFFILRDEGTAFPLGILLVACLVLGISDFLLKLIYDRDRSVMDAFLKTRPVPQSRWNLFLILSQCWKSGNLLLPLLFLPACFLFSRFPVGLLLFAVLYFLSVANGLLVSFIKHRGDYQSEKEVSTATHTYHSASGNAIFNLQVKSLIRSKRLRNTTLVIALVFLFQYVSQVKTDNKAYIFLFFFIYFFSGINSQNGLAVEASFFNGIWTRPIPLARILSDKCRMSAIMAALASLICFPLCLWLGTPIYLLLAFALFSSGFCTTATLVNAYDCRPFDLFGKTFYNNQGTYVKGSRVLLSFLYMGLAGLLPVFLPVWVASLVLGGLGLLGFAFQRPWFAWVERRFMANKHRYLERYMSI